VRKVAIKWDKNRCHKGAANSNTGPNFKFIDLARRRKWGRGGEVSKAGIQKKEKKVHGGESRFLMDNEGGGEFAVIYKELLRKKKGRPAWGGAGLENTDWQLFVYC